MSTLDTLVILAAMLRIGFLAFTYVADREASVDLPGAQHHGD